MTISRYKISSKILNSLGKYMVDYKLTGDQRAYFISNKLYGSYDYIYIIYMINGVKALYKANETLQVIDPKHIQLIQEMIDEQRINN